MNKIYLLASLILLLLLSVISLFIGVGNLNFFDLFMGDKEQWELFWVSRFPRLISIIITGAGLSVAGTVMQYLSRNKFVSPTTAGLGDFARLGVLIAILISFSIPTWARFLIAFSVTFLGSIIFMLFLERVKQRDSVFVPLVGLMLGKIVLALTIFIALQFDLLQSIGSWLQGDFSTILAGRYEVMYLSCIVFLVFYWFADRIVLVAMGRDVTTNLGINYNFIVYTSLALVSLMTATIVITVGMVPFVGLVVPNLVSLWFGDNMKRNLIVSVLFGAILVLICDIFGRIVIYPAEISVNLTMGIIGGVIFLWLLLRKLRNE